MQVTAEGVETPEQAKQLRRFNCDLVQGFLFSRPLNMVDVAAEIIKSAEIKRAASKPVRGPTSATTHSRDSTVVK